MHRPFIALAALMLTRCAPASAALALEPCRSTATPAPVQDLEPTSLRFAGTFTAAGQTMAITSTVAVTPHPAGGWAVVERAQLPRGLAVDSARLEAQSLAPAERTIQQGLTRITLGFTATRATGALVRDGQTRPIDAALCGSLVGDGAGAFLVIGRLPLAAGYRATLQHFEVQAATATVRQLVVVGSEPTTVAAGRFDTWKVQVGEAGVAGGTTIWVDKASLAPVKFSTSQGPVTIMMELSAGIRPIEP
jgi:hypothetical protein